MKIKIKKKKSRTKKVFHSIFEEILENIFEGILGLLFRGIWVFIRFIGGLIASIFHHIF